MCPSAVWIRRICPPSSLAQVLIPGNQPGSANHPPISAHTLSAGTPSLIVVWVLGLLLAMTIGAWDQGWFHAKLLFVLLLTAFHGIMVARSKKMVAGERPMTEKQLRIWGEFPGIALAIIVVLVIVKPF